MDVWVWIAGGTGSLLVGGFTFWLRDQNTRLRELEAKQTEMEVMLGRMDAKLDILLEK